MDNKLITKINHTSIVTISNHKQIDTILHGKYKLGKKPRKALHHGKKSIITI